MGRVKLSAVGLLAGLSTTAIATNANALELFKTDTTTITLYGQVNKGVLWADDGFQDKTYAFVDNDNSSTRFGLKSTSDLGAGWNFKTKFEFQWEKKSTANINALDPNDRTYEFRDDTAIRHIDFSIGHKKYGTFSAGQGSMASDGAADIDLSGTKVAITDPEKTAGGLEFFDNLTGAYNTSREIKDDFDNLDASRRMRLRYDSPELNGFTLSAAYGYTEFLAPGVSDNRNYTDAAVRYKNTFGDYKVQGAVFYAMRDSRTGRVEDRDRIGASGAVLHAPTGLNFRVALGQEDSETRTRKGDFVHAKVGIIKDIFKSGPTAFAVDYYTSDGLADEDANAESWGVSVVHKLKKPKLELYATYRNYALNETGVDYEDINAVLTGFRFKF